MECIGNVCFADWKIGPGKSVIAASRSYSEQLQLYNLRRYLCMFLFILDVLLVLPCPSGVLQTAIRTERPCAILGGTRSTSSRFPQVSQSLGTSRPVWDFSLALRRTCGRVRARAGACAVFLARRTEDVLVLLQGWRGLIQGIRAGGHGLHQRGPDTRSAEVSVVSTRSSEGKNGLAKLREKQVLEV